MLVLIIVLIAQRSKTCVHRTGSALLPLPSGLLMGSLAVDSEPRTGGPGPCWRPHSGGGEGGAPWQLFVLVSQEPQRSV